MGRHLKDEIEFENVIPADILYMIVLILHLTFKYVRRIHTKRDAIEKKTYKCIK